MVFDYTNERTFTDMMVRDFGEDRVEKVNFTAGTSGTKLQLKQDGLSILKQGYHFQISECHQWIQACNILRISLDETNIVHGSCQTEHIPQRQKLIEIS